MDNNETHGEQVRVCFAEVEAHCTRHGPIYALGILHSHTNIVLRQQQNIPQTSAVLVHDLSPTSFFPVAISLGAFRTDDNNGLLLNVIETKCNTSSSLSSSAETVKVCFDPVTVAHERRPGTESSVMPLLCVILSNTNALQYFHLVENKWRMLLSGFS